MDKLKQLIAVPEGRHFAVMEPIVIMHFNENGSLKSKEDGYVLHQVLYFALNENGEPSYVYLEYDGKECYTYVGEGCTICELDSPIIGDCVIREPDYDSNEFFQQRICLQGEDKDLIVRGDFEYTLRKWYEHAQKT